MHAGKATSSSRPSYSREPVISYDSIYLKTFWISGILLFVDSMGTFLTLNAKAVVAALVMGAVLLFLGGWPYGVFFFLLMLWFLVLAALVTVAGATYKKKKNLYEKYRSTKNVIANGLWPVIMALLFFLFGLLHYYGLPQLVAFAGFVAAVSAVSSDKFSSEIGVLDGEPRAIFGFKKVKKGTSGGITGLGLLAGLAGSLLVAVMALLVPVSAGALSLFLIIAFSGFAGTVFDSMLGFFEERGVGNKYTSNFFASALASLLCVLLVLAFI